MVQAGVLVQPGADWYLLVDARVIANLAEIGHPQPVKSAVQIRDSGH